MKVKYSPITESEQTWFIRRLLSVPSYSLIRSALPQIFFLICYGLNKHTHFLPLLSDLGCVHLNNMTAIEESLFGFSANRILSSHSNHFLDILAAIPYLLHYTIPILGPLYLYLTRGVEDVAKFFWLLGWASWILYVIWFIFPTAPPWLYDSVYGKTLALQNATTRIPAPSLEIMKLVHKEGCAFARLDLRSGVPFFYHMFNGNPVPFASFPSGHVVWPTCLLVTGAPGGRLFTVYVTWVAWATLYSCHHYICDALSAIFIVSVLQRLFSYISTGAGHRTSCSIACPLSMA